MSNLILHCGAESVTMDDVRAVPLPDRTDSYTPVPHYVALEQSLEIVKGFGLEPTRIDLGMTKEGARFFGTIDFSGRVIANGSSGGVSLAIGIRNSYDKSLSLGGCGGSRVFVCDNLAFAAEIVVTRLHTGNVLDDFCGRFQNALEEKLVPFEQREARRVSTYRSTRLEDFHARDIIVEAAKSEVIPWSHIRKVVEQWETPEHEEFEGRDLWSLYNGFTAVYRQRFERNPVRAQKETMGLSRLLDGYADGYNEGDSGTVQVLGGDPDPVGAPLS